MVLYSFLALMALMGIGIGVGAAVANPSFLAGVRRRLSVLVSCSDNLERYD